MLSPPPGIRPRPKAHTRACPRPRALALPPQAWAPRPPWALWPSRPKAARSPTWTASRGTREPRPSPPVRAGRRPARRGRGEGMSVPAARQAIAGRPACIPGRVLRVVQCGPTADPGSPPPCWQCSRAGGRVGRAGAPKAASVRRRVAPPTTSPLCCWISASGQPPRPRASSSDHHPRWLLPPLPMPHASATCHCQAAIHVHTHF